MIEKIKQKLRQIDALQQKGDYIIQKTEEQHTCAHCQTEYVGYTCPQCGMRATSEHFTFSTVLQKLLDSLGFDEHGNRSILRTLRDLLWRPGYMIRDYLSGHSAAYFQPFKLLLLLVIVFTLLIHLMGIAPDNTIDVENYTKSAEEDEIRKAMVPLFMVARTIIQWLRNNIAYSIVIQNVFIVTAMWKVYRRRCPYSWTETFIAQMYICCQFMILAIVQVLLTWKYEHTGLYFVNEWVVLVFTLFNFFQLYGERRFLPAIWRAIKIVLWIFLQYALLFILAIVGVVIYLLIKAPETIILET